MFLSKRLISSVSTLPRKIFPGREGKTKCSLLESIARLSSFTAHHSVILFCNNSIKLIVVLGNYPQPPAGQISIRDLNNAYQKEFNGIYLIRVNAFCQLIFLTQSPVPANSKYLSSQYLIFDKGGVAVFFKFFMYFFRVSQKICGFYLISKM